MCSGPPPAVVDVEPPEELAGTHAFVVRPARPSPAPAAPNTPLRISHEALGNVVAPLARPGCSPDSPLICRSQQHLRDDSVPRLQPISRPVRSFHTRPSPAFPCRPVLPLACLVWLPDGPYEAQFRRSRPQRTLWPHGPPRSVTSQVPTRAKFACQPGLRVGCRTACYRGICSWTIILVKAVRSLSIRACPWPHGMSYAYPAASPWHVAHGRHTRPRSVVDGPPLCLLHIEEGTNCLA